MTGVLTGVICFALWAVAVAAFYVGLGSLVGEWLEHRRRADYPPVDRDGYGQERWPR